MMQGKDAQTKMIPGFTPAHLKILRTLNTPHKIQDYLDTLPTNHEPHGDTCKSPLQVLHTGNAHCIEAAMLAALCLRLQGKPALLVDLTADNSDQDHVLAVYKEQSHWGAIAKSNHHALGFRDPIYKTLRELIMSYAHEYVNDDGKKTLRSYAGPLNLKKFDTQGWTTSDQDVWFVAEALVKLPHKPIVTRTQAKNSRPADPFQRAMSNVKRDKEETLRNVPFTRNER